MKIPALFSLSVLLVSPFFAKSQVDSTKQSQKWYKGTAFKTLATPVVLVGYGVSVTGAIGFPFSSRQVQAFTIKTFPDFHTTVDNYLQFSPAALAFGFKGCKVKSEHGIVDEFVLYGLSLGLSEAIVEGLKYTVHEKRPDGSDNLSFPSAHTSAAFAGAEFLHQEYINQSGWYSMAGYTLGTATGALRILNDKHWLSDVFVGAAIGILSTRLVYLVYPAIKKMFQKTKHSKGYPHPNY